MCTVSRLLPVATVTLALTCGPAIGLADETTSEVRDGVRHHDWVSFVRVGNNNNKVMACFAAANPTSVSPEGVKRGTEPMILFETWPTMGVFANPMLFLGYETKANGKYLISIGSHTFKLAPHLDRAFIADKSEMSAFMADMKAGQIAVIVGVANEDTLTTDVYSLKGVSAALDRAARLCPPQ